MARNRLAGANQSQALMLNGGTARRKPISSPIAIARLFWRAVAIATQAGLAPGTNKEHQSMTECPTESTCPFPHITGNTNAGALQRYAARTY
jgi:hypothetical protein